MTRNEKFIYINELGQNIELSLFSPFFVQDITGISGLNNIVYSSKGLSQDGSTYTGSTLSDRNIVIQGAIIRNIENNKSKLIKVFNPKLKGKLVYENQTDKKYVDCIIETAPSPIGTSKPHFQVSLLCNNPYWKEYSQSKAQIALWKPDFHFPLVIPIDTGIIMGHREPSLIVNVNNSGHVKTGMIIEFIAKGELANPSLFNVNTREFIKVNRTMVAGETITVNTNFNQKSIIRELNGNKTNVLNDLDIIGGGDTFLQLEIGDNLFRYDADSNLDNLEVNIMFSQQFLGV